jgi:DNA-binding FadR family transcriptional regulator
VLESLEGLLLTTRQATMQGRAARGKGDDGVIAAHARILDAIEAGDADGARAAMHAHLDETLRDLRAAPPADQGISSTLPAPGAPTSRSARS